MKKAFLLWLIQTRFYAWMLLKIIPYIRFTLYYTDFRGVDYHAGYEKLKKGDIVLGVDRRKLTHFLIPGTMTHAMACVGKRDQGYYTEICEMTHHDFTRSMFFDVCKEADRIVIMRCSDFDEAYVEKFADAVWSHSDAKYDCEFELGGRNEYCSELVYESDVERRMKVSLEDLAGLGRQYISPDGLMFGVNMQCVYDSDAEFDGLMGPEIKQKLIIKPMKIGYHEAHIYEPIRDVKHDQVAELQREIKKSIQRNGGNEFK